MTILHQTTKAPKSSKGLKTHKLKHKHEQI